LSPFSPADAAPYHNAFRSGLRDLGWVEGKNITIEYRYAEGKSERLPDLAADLVRLNVELIVTTITNDAVAAKNATRTIPIVMPAPVFTANLEQIANHAATSHLPSNVEDFAEAGGLVTYGPDRVDLFRRTASYVDEILKGAKPAELPVAQPTKFKLVINMKTA